jgi:hypothetical protein
MRVEVQGVRVEVQGVLRQVLARQLPLEAVARQGAHEP